MIAMLQCFEPEKPDAQLRVKLGREKKVVCLLLELN